MFLDFSMPSSVWIRLNFCVNDFYSTGITILISGICGPKFCSSVSLQGALQALWKSLFTGLFNNSSFNVREDVDPVFSHRGCRSSWLVKMPWSVCGFSYQVCKKPINFSVYVGVFVPGTFCQFFWVTLGTRNQFPPPPRCSVSCPKLGPLAIPAEGRLVSQVLAPI